LNTPQLPFLDDLPAQPARPAGLVVKAQRGRPLSKKQRPFNRLVQKVERLRMRLDAERRRLEAALVFHAEHLRHRVARAIALRKDLIRTLRPFLEDRRVSRRDKGVLRTILSEQLGDVLANDDSPLDDDLRTLFEELEGADLARVEQDEFDEMRTMVEAMFAEQGVTVDLSRFRPGMSDEEMAAAAAEMAADVQREARDAHGRHERAGRPKTRRELKAEERVAQVEELRKSSIGAVYRRLAKVLHPDLEPDPDRRHEKGAVMQQVTAAYGIATCTRCCGWRSSGTSATRRTSRASATRSSPPTIICSRSRRRISRRRGTSSSRIRGTRRSANPQDRSASRSRWMAPRKRGGSTR
jgi:hypothetical protein